MIKIILVLLSCSVYHVRSNDSCYVIKNIKIEVDLEKFPEVKYSSTIYFQSEDINTHYSIHDAWEPCSKFGVALLVDYELKQIGMMLHFLHLSNENVSCDQLNQLYSLEIHNFPLDYYYHLGHVGRNVSANTHSVCEPDLERLQIKESPKSIGKVIRNESFCGFTKLRALFLISNDIWEIEEDAFVCLQHLIEINLRSNNLSSLPQRVFSRNQRLQTANLGGNRFKSFVFSAFQSLPDFSDLVLYLNKIEILSEVIPLKRLKRLDLSDNNLREIDKKAFSELAKIERIDLSLNKLKEMHAETFRNNPEIFGLNMDNNALKSIPKIDNLYKLKYLSLEYNQITSINLWDLLDNSINLPDLSSNDNEIEEVVETSNSSLKYKHNNSETLFNFRIEVFENRIQGFENVILPNHVSNFVLTNGKIKTVCVPKLRFTPDSKVEYVMSLSENPLQYNSSVNRQLKVFYYQTVIRDTKPTMGFESSYHTNWLQSYREKQRVELAGLKNAEFICRIEFNRSEQCVCDGNDDCHAFTEDSLKANIIRVTEVFSDTFVISKYHMYFKGNNIENLKMVHFDDDQISEQCVSFYLEKSNVWIIENGAFNQMKHLEILSLRDNQIRFLPDNLLLNLTKLKELYLSNNRLITLTGITFKNVIKLELHNNSLTHLPIANTNQLLLSSSNLTNLSLHDNPWSCECEFIQPLYKYLGNNTDIIFRIKQIKCMDRNEYYNVLQFDLSKCQPFLYLTAITTSSTFAVVIIIIAVLVFLYRREVRVLIYSRYRLRIFGPEVDDDVSSKQYDAFMAYSSMDEDFLVNELMPGLEAIQNPYRLCIHERDFPAGAFIQDSIMEAVRLSSRTIVLLSQNFVDSGWCRLEFMTAHAQMLQDRCPRVLLIVLGEIPRTLDPEMELYLRTNTYLRWGERLFWDKLYYAMSDQRVTAPATDIMPMYQL